ncbi:right-handed parallel beta-helix repeat-containing protein [Kitasatospora sp. GAS204B]|uniref:right-handed parallel beta-helix repeat-containing protein n=2 Tax=Kitasatospora TaxID=2063 RepID=UPI002474F7FA|nr:right-handed parallel beta-helix repeat-containing protein [Kitasatospora sp. GAS204B]MDH6120131.1 hypothetical protein [Kitasatospora sp. GAS204B]
MPGQTVEIAAGSYNDTALTLTRSGTATAPITFRGPDPGPGLQGARASFTGGAPNSPDFGLVIKGAQHLRIQNLVVSSNQKQSIVVDNAQDVSITGVQAWGGGVHVTDNSSGVFFGHGQFGYAAGPLIQVDGGSTGTVVSTNMVQPNSTTDQTGIQVSNAPGTVVVSNTLLTGCSAGIVLSGGSTDAVLENNVVDTSASSGKPCPAGSSDTGISVSPDSVTGTKEDYDTVSPMSGGPAYNWGGTTYTAQQDFTTATGQGSHDYVSDPNKVWQHGPNDSLSPIVDSADENAPGMMSTDAWEWPPVDDPAVPNTGTGSGYRDRGAQEFQGFGSAFTPAGPTRLLDTRVPIGVPNATAVPAWGTVDLPVTGIAGVPATGVTAVTMNVTVTEPGADGHLTVYPHGDPLPQASNLNWTAGETIPNLVTVPVKDGKVSFYNASGGTVQLVADLAGYYSTTGSLFTSAGPTRLLDTRVPIGVPNATAVPAWGTVDLPVTGIAGVPATGVTAVTMNVTVTEPGADGHLTVYPHGNAAPDASNLNWTAGETIPNLVTVPVKDGKVSFYNASGGTVHLIADLAGYYSTTGRNTYQPSGPARLMDTRQTTYFEDGSNRPAGAVPAWGTLDISTAELPPNATSVTLNVTVTEPGADGHLTVYPHGDAAPDASNLNWTAGETIPNQVVVPVKDGKVSFYNASGAGVQLVVDLFGYQAY